MVSRWLYSLTRKPSNLTLFLSLLGATAFAQQESGDARILYSQHFKVINGVMVPAESAPAIQNSPLTNISNTPQADPALSLADLYSPCVLTPATAAKQGESYALSMQVVNGGNATAGASHAQLYLSTDASFNRNADFALGERSVPSLEAGADAYIRWEFTMPHLGEGTFDIWTIALVDTRNEVAELVEANGWVSTGSLFTAQGEALPDLQAPSFGVSDTEVLEGDPVTIQVNITNGGTAPAGASTAELYLSLDNDTDYADDTFGGSKAVGALAAGASQLTQWDLTLPNLGSDAYDVWLICRVDSAGEIVESNENNLWMTNEPGFKGMDVVVGTPDIRVEPLDITLTAPGVTKTNAGLAASDTIRLKKGSFTPAAGGSLAKSTKAGHMILQFEDGAAAKTAVALKAKGVEIVQYVPQNAVMAYVPSGTDLSTVKGLRWAGELAAQQKISDHLAGSAEKGYALVDVFPGVSATKAQQIVTTSGGKIVPNGWLLENTYLVKLGADTVEKLAAHDSVSWIWPASDAVIAGKPVHACPGPVTVYGPIGNYVLHDNGWDGPGLAPIALTYFFENGTPDIAGDGEQAEVLRALNEWSNYALITWSPAASAGLNRSFDISWASGDHGDGSPFDGPSGVLAHCYYPNPPNSEPIAGNMHFDEAETWRIGNDYDLFSVALHEAGHGLGIAHSDDDSAVMYAYYQVVSGLKSDDISAVRQLYSPTGDDADATFEIHNDGNGPLIVTDITPANDATWISLAPTLPYVILPGDSKEVSLFVGYSSAPAGTSNTRLLVNSNDPDESPYPNGVNVTVITEPAPGNDMFNSCASISGATGSVTGTNNRASIETGEPDIADVEITHSVWWCWQPAASGSVTINTAGSTFDTIMAVSTGTSVNELVTIASNDDAPDAQNYESQVTFNAVAGTTYHIAVDGYDGETGSIVLNWQQTVATPTTTAPATASPSATPTASPTASPSPSPSPTPSPTASATPSPTATPTITPTATPQPSPTVPPVVVDADRDGVDDSYEDEIGTNPNSKDSDGDGFEDGVEVRLGTDPLKADDPSPATDADSDGVPDLLDPNPGQRDADGDRYPDSWEIASGSNPNDPDSRPALGDADMNGAVDFLDAVTVFNIFLGNYDAEGYADETQLDVNRDGRVDSVDGVLLFNFYLENLPYLPFR